MKILFTVLLLLIGVTAGHYVSVDRRGSRDAVVSVVGLAGISQPAYSAAWYAPRMLISAGIAANPAYGELDPVRRSDFVYNQ